MLTGTGAWLRKQREARREMAHRLTQAALAVGDTAVPGIEHLCTYIRRWESSRHGPTERYVLYYCTAFGISADEFGTAPAPPPAPPPSPSPKTGTRAVERLTGTPVVDARLAASIAVAYRDMYGSDLGRSTVERELLMAAHEGTDYNERYESAIGETTLEQLRADLVRLSHLCDTGEPLAAFLDMRRVRDRIHRLLDRRLWPREQADLHFLRGCVSGLMGVSAHRLGYPDIAEELIRTGWASAAAIDHRPLMAQLRQQHSNIVYLRGWFRESSDLAVSGLSYLSVGSTAANLHLKHARAAARMGDAETARQAVREAHDARNSDHRDELVEMGGEYAVSEATHHSFAGAALAEIAGAEREAAEELERAIGLYERGPDDREEYWFAGKPLASIDLAVVRLRSGALDAAAAALEPALSLPAPQRIAQVITRLAVARDELAAPIFSSSAQARDLGEQIEDFTREAAMAGVHNL
jgi:tetratricopeptide (TPR) repeat protein